MMMMRSFLRLSVLLPAAVFAAPPVIREGVYPFLNATKPILPICAQGLGSVLTQALGMPADSLDRIKAILSQGGTDAKLFLERLDEINEAVDEYVQSSSARRMHEWQTAATSASGERGLAKPNTLGRDHAVAAHKLIGKAVGAFSLFAAAAVDAQSDDPHVVLSKALPSLGPENTLELLKVVEPALLYLFSPTWNLFLNLLVGHPTGVVKSILGLLSDLPHDGFTDPHNLLVAFGSTVSNSFKNDVDAWKRVCSIADFVLGYLGCSHIDVWDPKTCANLPLLPSPLTTCNGTPLPTVVDPFFPDIRAPENDSEGTTPKLPMQLIEVPPEDYVPLKLLWDAIQFSTTYATTHFPCNATDIDVSPMPGWVATEIISYQQPGVDVNPLLPRQDVPLVMVARPSETEASPEQKCDVVLIIRGTLSSFEWGIDLDTNLAPIAADSGTGTAGHRGVARAIETVWGPLQETLYQVRLDTGCSALRIMTTGHSLGAGIAVQLGYRLATNYPLYKVSVASFAAPRVLGQETAERFRELINARFILTDFDPVPKAPLSPDESDSGFPSCGLVSPVRNYDTVWYMTHPASHELSLYGLLGDSKLLNMPSSWLNINVAAGGGPDQNPWDANAPDPIVIYIDHITLSGFAIEDDISAAGESVKSYLLSLFGQRQDGGASEDHSKSLLERIAISTAGQSILDGSREGSLTPMRKAPVNPCDRLCALSIWIRATLPPGLQVGAAHICSYDCWTAMACEADPTKLINCTQCIGYSGVLYMVILVNRV